MLVYISITCIISLSHTHSKRSSYTFLYLYAVIFIWSFYIWLYLWKYVTVIHTHIVAHSELLKCMIFFSKTNSTKYIIQSWPLLYNSNISQLKTEWNGASRHNRWIKEHVINQVLNHIVDPRSTVWFTHAVAVSLPITAFTHRCSAFLSGWFQRLSDDLRDVLCGIQSCTLFSGVQLKSYFKHHVTT